MTRIQPKCYIQFFKYQSFRFYYQSRPIVAYDLAEHNLATYALFKIKPQSTTLAERLEARRRIKHEVAAWERLQDTTKEMALKWNFKR